MCFPLPPRRRASISYTKLTYEDGVVFSTLKQQGLSIRKVTKQMGRNFSTNY